MSEDKDKNKKSQQNQQKQPQGPRLTLMVKGTRDKCTLVVHTQKGNQPLPGKRVEFHFGLDSDDPLPVCQYLDGSNRPVSVETNEHGLGYLPDQDFSGIDPNLTCILAAMLGSTTKLMPLPVESGEPAYSFTKKVVRLKVTPEDLEIESRTGFYNVIVETFDENGKTETSQVSVNVDCGGEVQDPVTGHSLNASAISIPEGGRALKIVPDGCSASCTISRTAPTASVNKTLRYAY